MEVGQDPKGSFLCLHHRRHLIGVYICTTMLDTLPRCVGSSWGMKILPLVPINPTQHASPTPTLRRVVGPRAWSACVASLGGLVASNATLNAFESLGQWRRALELFVTLGDSPDVASARGENRNEDDATQNVLRHRAGVGAGIRYLHTVSASPISSGIYTGVYIYICI